MKLALMTNIFSVLQICMNYFGTFTRMFSYCNLHCIAECECEHSMSVTVRVYLNDGNLPAFLESSLFLLSCFRQKVLHNVLMGTHTHRGH